MSQIVFKNNSLVSKGANGPRITQVMIGPHYLMLPASFVL